MERVKKIDVHAHATPFTSYAPKRPVSNLTMPSPSEVISFYDSLDIERGILLPIVSPEASLSPITSEEVMYICDNYKDRFLWFCNVDPRAYKNTTDSDLGYVLSHYKSLGALGVGEITANMYFDDPFMENLFYHCEALSMPITVHITDSLPGSYGIVDDLGLTRLDKILTKFKGLKFFGHSQCFWSEIGDDNSNEKRNTYPTGPVREGRISYLMRKHENLYCDISAGSGANALMRDRDYTARFIEEFSDRILYGCDYCSPNSEYPYKLDEYLSSMRSSGEISEENYKKILRDNAIRVLNIKI